MIEKSMKPKADSGSFKRYTHIHIPGKTEKKKKNTSYYYQMWKELLLQTLQTLKGQ